MSVQYSEHSDVLYNETVFNNTAASSLLEFLPISIMASVSIGFPLNLLIAGIIVAQRRLHKPRHIFWLGVTFSGLFAQLVSLNELCVFYVFPDYHQACLTFVLFNGIPYANLLLNHFFCLLDHYVAITHPMWHKKYMKIKWIITAQLLGLVSISILFKTSYFVSGNFMSQITCDQQEPHGMIVIFTLMTLVLLCLIAQIVIYWQTKKNLIHKRKVECPQLFRKAKLLRAVEIIIEETSLNSPQVTDRKYSAIVVHVSTEATDKLEKEAAWTLAFGVISLLLISSPIFIAPLAILFCVQVNGNCASSIWIIPYFSELIIVHTIYKPIMYISRNRELFSA